MLKSLISLIISILVLFHCDISAQELNFIQINGGIIMPMSSSKGLSGIIQFNHPLSSRIQLYLYTGFSSWDKYKVSYLEDHTAIQQETIFRSYSADNHRLIPLYFGSDFKITTNKLFTFSFMFECGYSYLSYNSYKNRKSINPETGEVQGYYIDASSRKSVSENLFGVAIGIGLTRPLSENLKMILSYKLNSNVNSNYQGLFETRGTYFQFLAGFCFGV